MHHSSVPPPPPSTPAKSEDLDEDHATPTRSIDRFNTLSAVGRSPSLRRTSSDHWERQVEERLAQLADSLERAEAVNLVLTESLNKERILVQELSLERDGVKAEASELVAELEATKLQLDTLRSEVTTLRESKIQYEGTVRELETHLVNTKLEKADALAMLDLHTSTKRQVPPPSSSAWSSPTPLRNFRKSSRSFRRSQSLSAIPVKKVAARQQEPTQLLSIESNALDSIVEEELPQPRRASLNPALAPSNSPTMSAVVGDAAT